MSLMKDLLLNGPGKGFTSLGPKASSKQILTELAITLKMPLILVCESPFTAVKVFIARIGGSGEVNRLK
jgi:hypothetical protein